MEYGEITDGLVMYEKAKKRPWLVYGRLLVGGVWYAGLEES